MTQPALSGLPEDTDYPSAPSAESETTRAFQERVRAVVTPEAMGRFRERLAMGRADAEMRELRERVQAVQTPEALNRFRERLEMSRRHEEEHGSPGAFNGEVR